MFQSICDMVFFIVTVFSNNSNIYKSPLQNSGLQLITLWYIQVRLYLMLVIMQIILKVIILSSQKVHKVHDSIIFTKFSYSLVVQKMHDSLRLTNLSYSPIWFLTLLDLAELLRLRVKCFGNWFMFLQLGNLKDVKTLLMKLSFLKSKDFKDRKLNIR